jgi:hypothetical protein
LCSLGEDNEKNLAAAAKYRHRRRAWCSMLRVSRAMVASAAGIAESRRGGENGRGIGGNGAAMGEEERHQRRLKRQPAKNRLKTAPGMAEINGGQQRNGWHQWRNLSNVNLQIMAYQYHHGVKKISSIINEIFEAISEAVSENTVICWRKRINTNGIGPAQ